MVLSVAEQEQLRAELFAGCQALVDSKGGYVTRDELVNFELRGQRIGLLDRNRGIRNPQQLDATLSIVTAHDSPYDDQMGEDSLLRYAFADGRLREGDNRKLLVAYETRTPLILFEKPLPNVYVPVMPVFVVGVDEAARVFIVATSPESLRSFELADAGWIERRYSYQLVKQRVHQPVFRARVLVAYERTCAVCRLRHAPLLDAAHIIPDSDQAGIAAVSNGLALCKIHHAAYDQNLLGVDANLRVHVNRALLDEVDGPMLKHGIQEMDGVTIGVPPTRAWMPSREGLDARFAEFLRS